MFDVRDVLRKLGVEVQPDISWRVGAALRDRYQEDNDRLPIKELRRKTAGGGTHCFAVYPAEFWRTAIAVAESVIAVQQYETARQGDLFTPTEDAKK